MALLDSVRKDFKCANSLLSGIPASVTTVLLVNPSKQPRRQSRTTALCATVCSGCVAAPCWRCSRPEEWLTCAGRAIGDRPAVEDGRGAAGAPNRSCRRTGPSSKAATAYCSTWRRAASEPQDRQPCSEFGKMRIEPCACASVAPSLMACSGAAAMPSAPPAICAPGLFSFQSIPG